MAQLFIKQAKEYAESRPSYPPQLFQFVTSKTPQHDLAWDVGTGSGQAAQSLAGIYKNVIATDTSPKQLEFATELPNIRYQLTPPIMSSSELEQNVAAQGSVDLVTVAQAMHFFDLPKFYQLVKWVLKKPDGVIAAWCYHFPQVNNSFHSVFSRCFKIYSNPYWERIRKLVEDKYMTIDFPFEPVEGTDNTGPFEFVMEKPMDLDDYVTLIRSLSAYQMAKDNQRELLTDDVIDDFKRAWNEDGHGQKILRFPVYLRIGRVGNC